MSTRNSIKLVVFDMDGTITRPYLDFAEIRQAIGLKDPNILILDYIESLPEEEQKRANDILDRFEEEAAANVEAHDGAVELLQELSNRDIKAAIFTRNSRKSVQTVLQKLGISFEAIITRDDAPAKPLKPAPDAIIALLKRHNLNPGQALMVGDYSPDILAGKRAGIRTVLMDNDDGRPIDIQPDYRITNLHELLEII